LKYKVLGWSPPGWTPFGRARSENWSLPGAKAPGYWAIRQSYLWQYKLPLLNRLQL